MGAFGLRKILGVGVVLAIVAVGIYTLNSQKFNATSSPFPSASASIPPGFKGTVYENDYLKVVIPMGWTATQASNPTAVNIRKDAYIMYINTRTTQASGAEGGRFSEIAQGVPSADAVITSHPGECGTEETHPALPGHPRVDLYISAQDKRDGCNVPTDGQTHWFFSYIADGSAGHHFNYYMNEGNGRMIGYVITMAYNAKNINIFPRKDSASLKAMLQIMTGIAQTLEIKQR